MLVPAAPATQVVARAGMIELGFGQPDPMLLPMAHLRAAADAVLRSDSAPQAGAYGPERGPEALLDAIARRIRITEHAPQHDQLLITAGNSQALDEILSLLALPGDSVFVEYPTYNLALISMRAHHLELIPIPVDSGGMRVDVLERELSRRRARRRPPRIIYTIPTFHNPTGVSLEPDRRTELVALAAANGVRIIEDDVYRELTYDGPAPKSLWSIDPDTVIRLGTFSKSLAPGLRLGWMTASAGTIDELIAGGVRQSGGGASHFTAMIVARLFARGVYDGLIERLRETYRARRSALSAALGEALSPAWMFTVPRGGFFVWVEVPECVQVSELLRFAEEEGVSFLTGDSFFSEDPTKNHFRLAFSYYSPEVLELAVERLRRAIQRSCRRLDRATSPHVRTKREERANGRMTSEYGGDT